MVPLRTAKKMTGLCGDTLRKYADNGSIRSIRTPANKRLFDIDSWLRHSSSAPTVVCYCRVSSYKQQDDLARQVERFRENFPQAEIIKDIGSGLNFKRKGLKAILERVLQGDKLTVVVANRDRLARFGVDLIKFLIEKNSGTLLVLDKTVDSAEEELTTDLLAILHHFSCRMHGMRSHRYKKDSPVSHCIAEDSLQEMVRGFSLRVQQIAGSDQQPT